MAARDNNVDLEEAVEILSETVERNNREVEESFEQIYGDLEEHDEQIIELAEYARENRDNIEDNIDEIDDLWTELEDIDGGSTIDFTGIENSIRYVGGGIRNFFSWGSEKTEDFDPDRRKVLAGIAGAAAIDYINIVPGDTNAGDGAFRGGECGWDIDGFGLYGEQERCHPENNRSQNGTNGGQTPGGDPGSTDDTQEEPDVMYAERNGERIIPDESWGEKEALIDVYGNEDVTDYDGIDNVEEMIDEHGGDDVIYVTENDEIVVNDRGTLYSTTVEGVYEDASDGTLGDN